MMDLRLYYIYFFILQFVSASYHLADNSFFPPFRSSYWTSYGSTVFDSNFIRLTPDLQSKQGGIYNLKPLISRNWEVTILFHVHSPAKTLFGDGFAFWYTQYPPSPGPAFGNRATFRGLAVFFDTYANQNGEHSHEHPYVSAMVNDGTKQYDHDRDGTLTELSGCSSNFRNNDYASVTIRYSDKQLKVSLKYQGTENPVECFTVNGVNLPTGYYISVSAATGELSGRNSCLVLFLLVIITNSTIFA